MYDISKVPVLIIPRRLPMTAYGSALRVADTGLVECYYISLIDGRSDTSGTDGGRGIQCTCTEFRFSKFD